MIDPLSPNFEDTPGRAPEDRQGTSRAAVAYAPGAADPRLGTIGPQASIVTPAFNPDPALMAQTARCVFGQSLQAFEWIIVNDGSSEDGCRALETYRALAGSDSRVRVVDHGRNRGLPSARNTGVREARSPFVFLLDTDDLIEPTTVEKCVLTLATNPAFDIAHGLSVGFGGQRYLWARGYHDGPAFVKQNFVTATGMFRRSLVEQIGTFDESILGGTDDWEYWLRCAERGRWGCTIPEYLDWYRRRPPTDAGPWSSLKSERACEEFREMLRERYPRQFNGEWPSIARERESAYQDVPQAIGIMNPLKSDRPAVVLLAGAFQPDWLGRHLLELARGLGDEGWHVTLCAESADLTMLSEASRVTPDVFALDHYGPRRHHPSLMRYLLESRGARACVICGNELAYLVSAYLRASSTRPAIADFTHAPDDAWRSGGHARSSVGWGRGGQIDLSLVATQGLGAWMRARGREVDRIAVCEAPVGDARSLGRAVAGPLGEAVRRRVAEPPQQWPAGLLHELTVQAVEMVRVQRVADELWSLAERMKQERAPS